MITPYNFKTDNPNDNPNAFGPNLISPPKLSFKSVAPKIISFLQPKNIAISLGAPSPKLSITTIPPKILNISKPPTKSPYQDLTDLAQGPSLALGKFLIEPTWNFLSSAKELITGKPLPKLTIPALTKNIGTYANGSSYQQKYNEAVASGVPEKDAYRNTLIGGLIDAVAVAGPLEDLAGLSVRKLAPEALIKPTIETYSKETLLDYLTGRKTATELGIKPEVKAQITDRMKAMSTQEKSQFLQGFDLLDAKPSTLGKIFGVSDEEAKTILKNSYGGTTREASAGALPGYQQYKPNPQAGFVDFSGEPKRGSAVGFEPTGNGTPIPKDLQPLAEEARKYKSAEEFVKGIESQKFKGDVGALVKNAENGMQQSALLKIKSLKEDIEVLRKRGLSVKDEEKQIENLIKIHKLEPQLTDFYNKAVEESSNIVPSKVKVGIEPTKSEQVNIAAEKAKNLKPGEDFGPREQNLTPTEKVDKLIAKGEVRVVRRGNEDIYQIKKGDTWINTKGEDDVLAKLNISPKPKTPPKPKLYAKSDQEKLDFNKAQLDNIREGLANHPARSLLKYLKDGDFQDFKNPDLAETQKEAEKIREQNREIIQTAEKAFQGNPELSEKFDNPDTIREVIESYRNHRGIEKALVETKKYLNNTIVPLSDDNKIEIEILKNAKDKAVQERKRQIEKGQIKVNKEYEKEVQKRAKINSEIIKPVEAKNLSTFNPKASLDKETQGIYEKFVRKQNEAKVVPLKYVDKFPKTDALGTQAYDVYQLVGDAPDQKEIQDILSKLYKYAQDNGFPDLPHRKNYLPQMYKGTHDAIPALEVRKKMAEERLTKEGATPEEIKKYIDTMVDDKDLSVHLKKNAFFQKYKTFSSYAEAREYGYYPKYEKISELLGVYNKLVLQTTSARTFIDDLASAGKIVVEQVAPHDWQPIKYGPQGIKGYWASPKVGNFLDGIFRGHENMGLTDRIASGVAGVSKFGQNIALSGGIPGTSFNFFTAGILNKEILRGNLKAFNSFILANSDSGTIKSLQNDYKYIEMMARNGIPFHDIAGVPKENYESIKSKWGRLKSDVKKSPIKPSSYSPFFQIVGDSVDNVFGRKTFSNFMPLLHVQVFKSAYTGLIKKGVSEELAQTIATQLTMKSQGIIEDLGRSKLTQDKLTALFFAPVYRESIINTLLNTGKSITTEIKNPMYRYNRHLLAGLVVAFGLYNLLNKKLNDHYTWDNPQGHEADLRIPLPNGQVAYIPFMPGFLALPRSIIGGTKGLFQGDVNKAFEQYGTVLSMVVKTGIDVLTNTNYFGNPIYNDTDSRGQKLAKVGKYVGLEFNHPYVKELVNQLTDNPKPLYQSIIIASELPVKFSTQSKENTAAFYNAIDAQAQKNRDAKEPIQKIYNKIQELAKQGHGSNDQILGLVKDFTPEQKKIFKDIVSSEKSKQTILAEQKMLPLVIKIRQLIKEGKKQEVVDLVKDFSDEDKRIFKLASGRIE